ncbi:Nitroreductase NfnB [Diplonema papillatum]|nr:Nitroreductase NfnB [Diplonema papillatum]|eukprot:gene6210-9512_t
METNAAYVGGEGLPVPDDAAFQGKAATVTEAVLTRFSCRQFARDRTPDPAAIRALLVKAGRAASGGNLQSWRVHVATGATLDKLRTEVTKRAKRLQLGGKFQSYSIYPSPLKQPYHARRSQMGLQYYEAIGVQRGDGGARLKAAHRNYALFDAPVGLFVTIDKDMGSPQWSDVGQFLATFCLLAREQGLHTIQMEAWALVHAHVKTLLRFNEGELLFCGVGVGYPDWTAPVNNFRTHRADPGEYIVEAKL